METRAVDPRAPVSESVQPFSAVAALSAKPFGSLDEVIDNALRLMSDVIGVKLSMIHQLEGDTLIVSHVYDQMGLGLRPPVRIKRTDTFCDAVLRDIAPLIVLDADQEPHAKLPGKQIVGTKSYIGVPILLNDSRVFGTLCAHDRRALDLGQQEIDILLVLARIVASHIEREEALRLEEFAAKRLATRNDELTRANQKLVALNEIADSVAAHLNLHALLETVIASAVELLGAHAGAISLVGDSIDEPRRLTASVNLPESLRSEDLPASAGLMGQVISAGGPVIVERYDLLDQPLPQAYFHELAPWIAVPVWWEGAIVGTFGIAAKDPNRVFDDTSIELMNQVAKHAAVAIENARLYAASRSLGALEERNRLAADIHDTLAQSLLALSFQLRTARTLVASSPERAVAEIADAEQRAREALEEARRSVWNLGAAALEAGSLVEALQGEVSGLERFGLSGRLVVSGTARPLNAETQLALFRVAQESLANARKHAQANRILLSLDFGTQIVKLAIEDDGIGFDAEAVAKRPARSEGGFGLVAMPDRVARVGGRLEISSDPMRGGTAVVASIPYELPADLARSTGGEPQPRDAKVIRVVVADDHPATRAGIAGILSQQPGIVVLGTAADGEEAVSLVETFRPDVLMIDLRMPRLSGVEAISKIGRLGLPTKAVAVTTFAHDELIYQAMRAGARGYLLKDASPEDLASAVRVVSSGGTLLTPVVANKLAGGLATSERLTAREREVLGLLVKGLPDKEIAAQLGLSVKTANFHVANVIAKLGAQNRAEAVRLAYERGHIAE